MRRVLVVVMLVVDEEGGEGRGKERKGKETQKRLFLFFIIGKLRT
jgi:hypothetical protein